MIEINAKSASQLADDVESWLRSLPAIDPGEALDRVGSELGRVGSEMADRVPGRRRSRNWLSLALPVVVMAAIGVTVAATLWVLAHRAPTPDGFGLEEMVPDAEDFDRDAGIRAASEGMPAPDQAGFPADDGNLRAV